MVTVQGMGILTWREAQGQDGQTDRQTWDSQNEGRINNLGRSAAATASQLYDSFIRCQLWV